MPDNPLTLTLENGCTLRVHALAPHTFRIRLRPDAAFAEPALVRYGVLHVDGDAHVDSDAHTAVICSRCIMGLLLDTWKFTWRERFS
jgi:hypothetical protein